MEHVDGEALRETEAWRSWCRAAADAPLTSAVEPGHVAGRCHACGRPVEDATLCCVCVSLLGAEATP
jgi:hypothetical protein